MKTSKWLIEQMEAAVVTKQEVAEAIGVSTQVVSGWIDGKKEPSVGRLEQLKSFFEEKLGS